MLARAHLLPTIQQSEFHRREVSEIPTLRKEKKLDHEKASLVQDYFYHRPGKKVRRRSSRRTPETQETEKECQDHL
ncbi:hypothetical protein R3W88_029938 [Solanum pinnatisectum]|uniref:Uncharacterized protein n=1 Tax=Solanum pinnatisectum TaxID=50273 RepID=A0AAV9K6R6_9SOLN|nr:hypothetical protein R3W88_029938 [Solanum pinnatisectum]